MILYQGCKKLNLLLVCLKGVTIVITYFKLKQYGKCYNPRYKIQMRCASFACKEFAVKIAYHQLKSAYHSYLLYSTIVNRNKFAEKLTVNLKYIVI